jgi:hypothetical protein
VEDNWRVRWMTGYYYKLINKNTRQLSSTFLPVSVSAFRLDQTPFASPLS